VPAIAVCTCAKVCQLFGVNAAVYRDTNLLETKIEPGLLIWNQSKASHVVPKNPAYGVWLHSGCIGPSFTHSHDVPEDGSQHADIHKLWVAYVPPLPCTSTQ